MPRPRKRFGQHFLIDDSVAERVAQAIDPRPDERIVEIGPGKGALTLPLLTRVGQLDVVEIDWDLAARLEEKCRGRGELKVLRQDALRLDFATTFPARRLKLVGNLPYNISTPLLFHLLRFSHIRQMVFMLQKEVVDRLCAAPGDSGYGRLSVMAQAQCAPEKLFEVGPAAFSPPPKVHSALARLSVAPQARKRVKDYGRFSELVRAAFSQRRKKIGNSLKALPLAERLEALNIPPSARPEDLSVEDYCNLANAWAERESARQDNGKLQPF